jgi:transposase
MRRRNPARKEEERVRKRSRKEEERVTKRRKKEAERVRKRRRREEERVKKRREEERVKKRRPGHTAERVASVYGVPPGTCLPRRFHRLALPHFRRHCLAVFCRHKS